LEIEKGDEDGEGRMTRLKRKGRGKKNKDEGEDGEEIRG